MTGFSLFPPGRLARLALLAGGFTAMIGILGLIGLATGLIQLRSFFPGLKTMAFSTSLVLVFFGVVAMTAPQEILRGGRKIAVLALLALVAVLSAGEIAFSILGLLYPPETMLVQLADVVFGRPTVAMSPVTSALVLIAAVALFLVVLGPSRPTASPREQDAVGIAGLVITLIGITILLGYLYHAPYLNGDLFTTTAAPTAAALAFLGISLTAAAGRAAIPARYFYGTTTTSLLLRSFVPLTIVIVIVQGFFHDFVDIFIGADSRALIFSVSIVFFSIATGMIVARTSGRIGTALEDAESRQKAAEQELLATNEELTRSNEELAAIGTELEESIDQLHRNEQALLESRQRLERTQEIAGLGSWDLDLVKNNLTWSDEVYRIFGLAPQEFGATYEAFLDAIHPDDRDAVNAAYSRSLKDGSSTYEIDHRVVRRSTGEVRYVHEKCDHLRNDKGIIVRSVGMIHDITERKEAEKKLVDVIASWNATFNAMNDQVCLMDTRGTIVRCNQSMEALAGPAGGSVAGKTCHDLIHGSAAFIEDCPLQAMLKSGKRETLGLQRGERWFIVSADPVRDTAGSITGAVHVMRDITDQKMAEMELVRRNEELGAIEEELRANVDELGKTEQDLRETSQYLENLIEYANAPIIVWDPAFTITRFNRAFERLTGRPAPSVIGKKLEILFPQESLEASLALIRKTISGERWESVEIPILHAHGSIRTMLWNSATLYRPDGKTVLSIIAQGQDITDRNLAEERLRRALANWDVTFNAMNDQVSLFDHGGKIEICNAGMTRFFGLPQEKIIGRTCRELLADRAPGAGECPVDRTLVSGTRETAELAIGNRWFAVTADPIRDPNGSITGGVQIFRDITEQKRLEMEMVQSLREKEVLLKEIHHRVKNNIQVISSILNLQSSQARDASTKEIFRETQNKVKGIALIHEKLYRSRSLSRIDYAEYLKDIATYTFQSYNINSRQIDLRIDAGDVAIDIDRAVPLSLIVTELLSNALKHAFPDGRTGRIAIDIHRDNGRIVLEFSDNGIGIPASVTFDKGDTLGMKLLAGLTRQLSGTIAIDRTGGTRYTIAFPADGEGRGNALPAPAGVTGEAP